MSTMETIRAEQKALIVNHNKVCNSLDTYKQKLDNMERAEAQVAGTKIRGTESSGHTGPTEASLAVLNNEDTEMANSNEAGTDSGKILQPV